MTIERKGRKKTRPTTKIIVFIALGLLLLVGIMAIYSWITGALVDVQPLSKSVLEEDLEAEFLVIREEHSFTAPFPGRLELLAKEGEKVPKGAVVAYLYKAEGTSLEATSKTPLLTPAAGVFSMQLDGLESVCNPQVWSKIDVHKLPGLEKGLDKKEPGNASERELAAAGTPLFKVVDNLSPSYLFLETEQLISERIKKGRNVELRLPELTDLPISGSISDIYQEDGKSRILIEIPSVSNLEKFRRVNGKLILAKYEGMVVAENILVKKNGLTGVYLLQNGRAFWQEVTIRGTVEKKVALSGLQEGQWIITTPSLVKEGQRVFRSRR